MAKTELYPYPFQCLSAGVILTPLGCFVNHSCTPNVTIFSLHGPKTIYYANKPIKKGEEVCNRL